MQSSSVRIRNEEKTGDFGLRLRNNSGLFLGMGPIGCSETSVRNYRYSLRNNPEERSSQKKTCGMVSATCREGEVKSRVE